MGSVISVISIFAVGYAVFAGALFFYQPNLLYFPDMPGRELTATPLDIGLQYEPLKLASRDGEQLDAWFVPASRPRGVLLFFHGNAGNISHRLESIRLFHELGLSVLIFDYRGYGQSSGKPSEQGSYLDADTAWEYLVGERGVSPAQIILFGRSLGAAIAADLATRQAAAALILESAFTSVPDIAASLYPWLPVRWLSRFRYDSRSKLARFHGPVLIVHSREDEIIPFTHGERLFEAAREPKQLLELRGGHNDGFLISRDGYMRAFDGFLGKALNNVIP